MGGGGKLKPSLHCNFKTYSDLILDIKNNIDKIPDDIDLVVGIPRSGMIPACMIGFLKNCHVVSINEFVSLKISKFGKRPVKEFGRNVLVVDDSCFTGNSINECKKFLKSYESKFNIKYAAIYTTQESMPFVDISITNVSSPRMFQWNYLNHQKSEISCFDLDGVLCFNPSEEQNDDGVKYIEFIKNARPLYIPKYKIKAIVTARLEKYRMHTEKWLNENGVLYEKLYMLDLPSKEARIRANAHAKFKAKIYNEIEDALYFYESDRKQAKEIFELTLKPVICTTTDEIFQHRY